jgi:AraC family transcriptional regulator, regulatory protein of adaptative response / DNA-3-methyladenine glycosylase II
MELDHDICYRAVKSRDARFDGRFFTAVKTTRIYCRPICPAMTPKAENCLFFACAAAAQEAGFRSCLRCRPELSPDLIQQLSKSAVVTRALKLIDQGTLDQCSVEELAGRLGIGERHLRRLFQEELGASPLAVGQTRRILLAKQLLNETDLSISDVAMASGFGSIRRFNDVIRQVYKRMPSELRRARAASVSENMSVRLFYRPPYNWQSFIDFLKPRATPGVEEVADGSYRRTISLQGVQGVVQISPQPGENCLRLTICFPNLSALPQIVGRFKQIFDCSANVDEIARHLMQDESLAKRVLRLPGLRVPGAWDRFELAVRAILGQQVSVRAATTLAGRLAEAYGMLLSDELVKTDGRSNSTLSRLFPQPQVLAKADLTAIGLTKARARAVSALAAAVAEDETLLDDFVDLEDAVNKLCRLPGIGEWTAQYIAMRALREPDAFPGSDLGLLRAMSDEGIDTPPKMVVRAEAWRPWRAYAAMYLWQGMSGLHGADVLVAATVGTKTSAADAATVGLEERDSVNCR